MQAMTKARLQQVLTEELSLKTPEFDLHKYGKRISGSVISQTFKGKRDIQRQKLIWDALDRALGPESVGVVGMLLAYTPDEWNADRIIGVTAQLKAG